jgi:signal peptidase I
MWRNHGEHGCAIILIRFAGLGMLSTRWFRPFYLALLLIFMASAWILFAPEPYGGQASYVIVAGASMEPEMHVGDLAIVRKAQVYQVGDVVTYRHPIAGPIIHRIIDRIGDRYVFKGDNNDWIDSYYPSRDEFIGKLWIHLPHLGQYLRKLRSPASLTMFSLFIAAGVFSSFMHKKTKVRSESNPKRSSHAKAKPFLFRDGFEGVLFAIAVLAFASGILAIIAFTRPITIIENEQMPYEFRGVFQYTAQAPAGIYDSEQIKSGDPIYFQLTDRFEVDFQFQLFSEALSDVSGMLRLDAELSDPGGWRRMIELHPSSSFSGKAAEIRGVIDLSDLRSMTESLEGRTGFDRPYYTLEIVPSVTAKARYNGNEILDHFEPHLVFRIEEFQVYLISTEPSGSRLDQLEPRQTAYITRPVEQRNLIQIFGLGLPVSNARWISIIGLVMSFGGLLALAIIYFRAAHDGEEAHIAVKYGSMIVDVREGNFVNGYHRVEVGAIEDLGRFAERVGGVILHEKRGQAHHYYVQEGNITYHYQINAQEQAEGKPADFAAKEIESRNKKRTVLKGKKEKDEMARKKTSAATESPKSILETADQEKGSKGEKGKSGKAKTPRQSSDLARDIGAQAKRRRKKPHEDA